jgi:hypothetical protein
LASRRLTFREVFEGVAGLLLYVLIELHFRAYSQNLVQHNLAA